MSRITLSLVVLLACASLAAATRTVNFVSDDSGYFFVYSGSDNYAITSPHLNDLGWTSVSVNGPRVSAVTPGCRIVQSSFSELSHNQQSFLDNFRQQYMPQRGSRAEASASASSASGFPPNLRMTNPRRESFSLPAAEELHRLRPQPAGGRQSGRSDQDFAFTRSGFSRMADLVAVRNNVATFARDEGHVRISPLSCLDDQDRDLISRARQEMRLESSRHSFRHSFHLHDHLPQGPSSRTQWNPQSFMSGFGSQHQHQPHDVDHNRPFDSSHPPHHHHEVHQDVHHSDHHHDRHHDLGGGHHDYHHDYHQDYHHHDHHDDHDHPYHDPDVHRPVRSRLDPRNQRRVRFQP